MLLALCGLMVKIAEPSGSLKWTKLFSFFFPLWNLSNWTHNKFGIYSTLWLIPPIPPCFQIALLKSYVWNWFFFFFIANCNQVVFLRNCKKNVHTGNDIFGSLTYTMWLDPGAAVWSREGENSRLRFFFSIYWQIANQLLRLVAATGVWGCCAC